MSRLLLIWVQKPFSQREEEAIHQSWWSRRIRQISTELWAIKTSGHNPWIQSQRYKRFANTVQYLVQACRPTRELTTEHELVRSVVPSTPVSWCVWHIDHTRHMEPYSRLTCRFPDSHTTRKRHFHRLSLSPYVQNICTTYIINHNQPSSKRLLIVWTVLTHQCDEWLEQLQCQQRSALSVKNAEGEHEQSWTIDNAKEKEKRWPWETFSLTDISYQVMANSTSKEEIDFTELKKETRASFLCGFETLRA